MSVSFRCMHLFGLMSCCHHRSHLDDTLCHLDVSGGLRSNISKYYISKIVYLNFLDLLGYKPAPSWTWWIICSWLRTGSLSVSSIVWSSIIISTICRTRRCVHLRGQWWRHWLHTVWKGRTGLVLAWGVLLYIILSLS